LLAWAAACGAGWGAARRAALGEQPGEQPGEQLGGSLESPSLGSSSLRQHALRELACNQPG